MSADGHRRSSLNALAKVLETGLAQNDMDLLYRELKAFSHDKALHADAIDVIANVHHFIGDRRVRNRHAVRGEEQETEMRRLLEALREGRSRDELLDYTFLG